MNRILLSATMLLTICMTSRAMVPNIDQNDAIATLPYTPKNVTAKVYAEFASKEPIFLDEQGFSTVLKNGTRKDINFEPYMLNSRKIWNPKYEFKTVLELLSDTNHKAFGPISKIVMQGKLNNKVSLTRDEYSKLQQLKNECPPLYEYLDRRSKTSLKNKISSLISKSQ